MIAAQAAHDAKPLFPSAECPRVWLCLTPGRRGCRCRGRSVPLMVERRMTSYVALLYSIGIGAGRRLVMSDWRSMMESIGLKDPRTLIATGNAVFQSRRATIGELENRLERAFEQSFGRRVDTIVRTGASWQRLVASNPFSQESSRDGSSVVVRLMRVPLDEGTSGGLDPYATQGERLIVMNGDLWIHFPQQPNRSRLLGVLTSERLGVGTIRNWNTVRRLSEMLVGYRR
jgi:uncharacterized protein (DUF1697 family)